MKKQIPDILLYLKDENSSDIIKAAFSRLIPPEPDDFIYLDWDSRIHLKHYSVLVDEQNYISRNFSVEEIEEYVVDFETSLKKYAEGFKNGYFDFKTYLNEKVENDYMGNEYMDVIFKLVHDIYFKQPYPISRIGDNIASVEKDLFEFGKNSGYLYKAWEIIFKNQDVFEPMFKNPDKKEEQREKLFVDYLKHPKPEVLAQKIKENFAGKKGKELSFLLHCLEEAGYFIDEHIEKTKLYKAMAVFFEKPVGADPSINKLLNSGMKILNIKYYKTDHDKMKKKLDDILNSI